MYEGTSQYIKWVAFIGSHAIRAWSSTQPVVALSSAETELTGLSKGGTIGIGLQSLCLDLGLSLQLRLHSDSTAAIGVRRRRGLGKIRHLAVADLWLQDRIQAGQLSLHKVLGADNPADAMTKFVERTRLANSLARMGLECEDGRAATAAHISNCLPDSLMKLHRGAEWQS